MTAAELDAIAIPDTGRLLFTLTVDHEVDPDGTAALVANFEEVAQQLAPGRWQIVVLAHGLALDILDDAALVQVGLQRSTGDCSACRSCVGCACMEQ